MQNGAPWPASLSLPNSTSTPADPNAKTARQSNAPTLADVAREAGVSKMAASTALHGTRSSVRVSAETRERVMAVAERLRYRPNANARALAYRRTNSIGLVANFMGHEPNLYFLEVFTGFIQGAMAAAQTTAVFTLGSWDEAPTRIPALCDGRVDGLVVLGPRLEDDGETWLPERTPMVSVHANRQARGKVNFESDDAGGAYELVRRMLALGHRRILHVAGPQGYPGADRRVDGYLRAHADAGVTPLPDHVVHAAFTADGGRAAMEAWLQRHRGSPLPEAVFGGNDAIAAGCMETLVGRGLKVPGDVSVAGFDHTLLARTLHMAAARQPLQEMGRQAVVVLMQLIETQRRGEPYEGPLNIVLPTEVVPGRTLAKPRRRILTIA
jgi:LacI family transcriptional regulator